MEIKETGGGTFTRKILSISECGSVPDSSVFSSSHFIFFPCETKNLQQILQMGEIQNNNF